MANTFKEEPSAKEKKKKTKGDASADPELKAYFTGNRPRILLGLFLLLFSVLSLVGFISYSFTWKEDFAAIVGQGSWTYLFTGGDSDVLAGNWLGRFGAWISHLFVREGFGLAAIGISYLAFVIGVRVLFVDTKFKLFRLVEPAITFMIFISGTLGYIFGILQPGEVSFLGGAFGFYVSGWIAEFIGSVGAGLFWLVAWLAMISIRFNWVFTTPSWFNASEEAEFQEEVPLVKAAPKVKPKVVPEPEIEVEAPVELEDDNTFLEEPEEDSNDFDFETPSTPKPEKEPVSNTEFEVVMPEPEMAPPPPPVAPMTEPAVVAPRLDDPDELSKELLAKYGPYDPYADLPTYQLPILDLLMEHGDGRVRIDQEELQKNKDQIVETLSHYKIDIDKIRATVGPTVTLYEIVPAPGVKISKIKSLEADIAMSLAALGIRIIAPMPGKGTIGIEVPNKNPEIVSMRSLLASEKFQESSAALPIALGKTITNDNFIVDLAKMPHLLVAGSTGQGKSVGINAILMSLLYKKHPADLKFVLVDPKRVELPLYQAIERHFLAKLPNEDEAIITDVTRVVNTLNALCVEMDLRYGLLQKAMVREIKAYNQKFKERKLNPENGHRYLPYIVVVVDEFADLIVTAGREVETPIARIAQLARAVGIHLIIATQRPSVNVITGTIKANFPGRIAFRVSSKVDSRTILDEGGADQLVGRGDMLVSNGADLVRLQCAFVDTPEVENVCNFIGSQKGYTSAFLLPEPEDPDGEIGISDFDPTDRDKMFDDAARIVVQFQQGSASLLQRKLKLGYNRAGRIIDQLEAAGIVGSFEGAKARQVMFSDLNQLEEHLKRLKENE
jgi:DNA segregation ATPase FtsK/SpoIIIE, S-DNA-T family